MCQRLAHLSQHLLFRRSTTQPFHAATKTLCSSSTRFLSSGGQKTKQMVDEVGEARKAAAKQMEEAADAGTVSHRETRVQERVCVCEGSVCWEGKLS